MKLFVKRLFIFVLVVFLLCTFLTSCDGVQESNNDSTAATTTYGSYYLYETHSKIEYLKFLDDFDYNTYEIVDISVTFVGMVAGDEYGNHYAVTYRVVSE